jgi:hypothetical protein
MKLDYKKFNYWYVLLALGIILLLSMNYVPTLQSVAELEGRQCVVDEDCLCWGSIDGIDAYGIGTGRCINGACNMDLCVDIQPIGDFFINYPFRWFKDNLVLALGLIIISIMGAVYLPNR